MNDLTYVSDDTIAIRISNDSFAHFSLKDAEQLAIELTIRIASLRKYKEKSARERLEQAQQELNELDMKRSN